MGIFTGLIGTIFVLVLIVLGLGLYFLPTIVAQQKRHASLGGIFVLNFLLGWSLLGWIGALVWALSSPQPVVIVQNGPAYLPPGYGAPPYPQQQPYPQQPYPQQPYPQQSGYPQQPYPQQYAPPVAPDGLTYVAQPAVVMTPVPTAEIVPPPETR